MTKPFIVTLPEAGQKLHQFLCRRLHTPKSILHRWIRTGQIRVNGKRTQAFTRLSCNDLVRIPPFAENDTKHHKPFYKNNPNFIAKSNHTYPLPTIIKETHDLLIISKPAGLPTHGGTGHLDSIAHRLSIHYANEPFIPTPVHRLDKETTGLLLIAKNYTTLKTLASSFAQHTIQKEYLAWVIGLCPWDKPIYLEDTLINTSLNNKKYSTCHLSNTSVLSKKSKQASLTAYCVEHRANHSLLHIKLHTGRTHQIRTQLSARNYPIVGDKRYGDTIITKNMKLHAFRMIIDNTTYESIPPWKGFWAIDQNNISKESFYTN